MIWLSMQSSTMDGDTPDLMVPGFFQEESDFTGSCLFP